MKDWINIIIAFSALLVTAAGVWVAYLTLQRTPKLTREPGENVAKHRAGVRKSMALVLLSVVAASVAIVAALSSPLLLWARTIVQVRVWHILIAVSAVAAAAIFASSRFQRKRPVVAVQTDYGTQSPYIGALMGAIYSIDPVARVQMITADVNSYDRIHGAWMLRLASAEFPKGTIFICVTNPGGTTAQPSIIQTRNGHIYVGHDNGLFDLVVRDYGLNAYYFISGKILTKPRYQSLFGISLFAPAAAYISKGVGLHELGTQLSEYEYKLDEVQLVIADDSITATLMDVDRFGNATTNIREQDIKKLGIRFSDTFSILLKGTEITFEFRETYGQVSEGSPVAIMFLGYVQFALQQRNFAHTHGAQRGDGFVLRKLARSHDPTPT